MKNFGKKNYLYSVISGVMIGAFVGCGGTHEPPLEKNPLICKDEQLNLLDELNPTRDIDSLYLYISNDGPNPDLTRQVGGPTCIDTIDIHACQLALETLTQGLTENAILIGVGNDFELLQEKDQILELLGVLDNAKKVAIWLHINDYPIDCNIAISDTDSLVWTVVFREQTQSCSPIVTDQVTINIDAVSGMINEVERKEVSRLHGVCVGRMPPGEITFFSNLASDQQKILGAMLAHHAACESASVTAFQQLKRELVYHGAPAEILTRIDSAIKDEIQHARDVETLARQYGCEPEMFSVADCGIRNLEAIAIDNMEEGCVGETWGAMIGLYQAQHAQDPHIAATMNNIAQDEVEHAALSWAIHEWIIQQLDTDAVLRVEQSRWRALNRLRASLPNSRNPIAIELAGLPDAQAHLALANQFITAFAA